MNSWPNFSGPELCGLEAHQVVKILKAGQVSPAELLEAAVQRISQTGPVINATPTICETRARKAVLDPQESGHAGWLAGLPISIKDLNAVAGVPSTYGTKVLQTFLRHTMVPLVEQQLSRAGLSGVKTEPQ